MDEDAELVARARAGDLAAFDQLVVRHRSTVFAVAARIVGLDDADDVAQDAFLRAFHRLDQYRSESSFRTWLLRITHNAALSELERRRPRLALTSPEGGRGPDERDIAVRTPAEQLERSEQRDRLAEKIGQLRPEHRAVLVLRDLEGLSYQEIADVTETPVGSVKGRLNRARSELIDLLRQNAYDWDIPR